MTFIGRTDHRNLGEDLFDPIKPAQFGAMKGRYFNTRAAQTVGLEGLDEAAIERHFGRFEPLPGSLPEPLALRYHGHQFQVYNPDIGDGRGFLFAQCSERSEASATARPERGRHSRESGPTRVEALAEAFAQQTAASDKGRLLDFGTKGTGTTPYSRSGDGRLTLKGAVRELLATTMLAAQGVPTSRTFAIVEDLDTQLYRGDEPSPTRAAVLTRLSHSHIRFGTFQRLAYEDRREAMERLVRYVLRTYYFMDEGRMSAPEAVQALLKEVVRRKALTVAAWMMAGFVHGVLNTDNMNVTGESFDYGPWRWVPTYDGTFTAAYFDQQGLYAYGRQPRAVSWNLSALASALTLIHPKTEPLRDILTAFSDQLQAATIAQFFWRTRLHPSGDKARDTALAESVLKQLKDEQSPFEDLFYALETDQRHLLSDPMRDLLQGWQGDPTEHEPEGMLIEEVEALWAAIAERDDWAPLQAKVKRLDRLYDLRQAWEAPAVKHMEDPR